MSATAVVIGAGFAGLCAARALRDRFDRVVIVEADTLPAGAAPRKGVPQDHQPHTLHLRGARELEVSFPGFERELLAQGGDFMDVGLDVARLGEGGFHTRAEVGFEMVAASRPLLERVVRTRLLASTPNVSIVQGVRVRGLVHEREGQSVRVRGIETEQGPMLADLVVDAGGRGSRALRWLEAAGVAPPEVERVDAHFSYSTRVYVPPPVALRRRDWWWKALIIDAVVPSFTRYGIITPIEGGRWLVTAGGVNGDHPPRDEAGYLAFLRSLRSPLIAEALRHAQPCGDVVHTRATECVWQQMHRLREPARGILLVGDAVCAPNPAYGQGITKAVLEAQALEKLVAKKHPESKGFERAFYRAQHRTISRLWKLATALDLRWPGTEGERSFAAPFTAYFAGLYAAAAETDPVVLKRTLEISQSAASDWAALTPDIVARVLRANLRPRTALPRPQVGVDLTGAYRAQTT